MDHYAKPSNTENRLTPAEVEIVLRRAAELNAHRKGSDTFAYSISPEVLVQVAAAAGIAESDVRRALVELFSDRTFEPDTLACKLYGKSRLKAVREVERPAEATRTRLEDFLRHKQGLKLRRKTEANSLWDAGDPLGTVRRALDFSGHHTLLKVRSLELRVEDVGYGRSGISLIADVSNQRGEQLSLGGILGATLALPLAIAGVYDLLYFLAVVPAFVAPGLGFKLAYKKTCADVRQALDALLDAAAEEEPAREESSEQLPERNPGQIRSLEPIPKFTAQEEEE
ncbi:MAG: hypothetical protein M3118_00385 [Actinomycetota bacterium]|nr:hypothetical protein [Actinomycetota bacterium]